MLIFLWVVLFVVSLMVLVKSADWFIEASEKIAKFFKISPFIIGVTIVALGTSLPELLTSLVAVFNHNPEIVVANILGSNIANILLIAGIATLVAAGGLSVKRNIIDLDLPLLFATSVIFIFIILDKKINFLEGIILIVTFLIYLFYTIKNKKEEGEEGGIVTAKEIILKKEEKKISPTLLYLIFGIVGLAFGARFTVESIVNLAQLLNLTTSFLAITAIAIGTSLPELVVSVSAAAKGKHELAIGNVLGSNIFNLLIVGGIPALFGTVIVDDLTFTIGLPFFAAATMVFLISGISRRIHIWEGLMFLILYALFIIKLFGFF